MIVQPAKKINGTIAVPGDKSIAHRALILGAVAEGKQLITNLPRNARDVKTTWDCLRALGTRIEETNGGVVVQAGPLAGKVALNAENSGTTARLLSGLIAGHPITATIDGDASLRARPMTRIVEPLTKMGAHISTADHGRLPLTIDGGNLSGIRYTLPVASAQVKSAVLIAGLFANGTTRVVEPRFTRDHTERMLQAMSAAIERSDNTVSVIGRQRIRGIEIDIPSDISSAMFFVVAATCLENSRVHFANVGTNPTRMGAFSALTRMGGNVLLVERDNSQHEPRAQLIAESSTLRAVELGPDEIPGLIDELPILAVAATQAKGTTTVRGASELRHKESDRIGAIVGNLSAMGADIVEREDGFTVAGPTKLKGAKVDSHGDHRIAMALAIAALLADSPTEIMNDDVINISYPGFFDDLQRLLSDNVAT